MSTGPGRLPHAFGDRGHLAAVADVAGVTGRRAGALRGRRGGRALGAGPIYIEHAHRGAERGAAQRQAAPQARGAAGDQHVLAGDGRHDGLPRSVDAGQVPQDAQGDGHHGRVLLVAQKRRRVDRQQALLGHGLGLGVLEDALRAVPAAEP